MDKVTRYLWPFAFASTALHALPVAWLVLKGENVDMSPHDSTQSFTVEFVAQQPSQTERPPEHRERKTVARCAPLEAIHTPEMTDPTGIARVADNASPPLLATPAKGNPKPDYPQEARENQWEGTVMLAIEISPHGTVSSAQAVEPRTYPCLEASAIKTARRWRFNTSGITQSTHVTIPVRFELEG